MEENAVEKKGCECEYLKENYDVLRMKATSVKEVVEHLYNHHLLWIWSVNELGGLIYYITKDNRLIADFDCYQTDISNLNGDKIFELPENDGKNRFRPYHEYESDVDENFIVQNLENLDKFTLEQQENISFDLFLKLLYYLLLCLGEYGNNILEFKKTENNTFVVEGRVDNYSKISKCAFYQ